MGRVTAGLRSCLASPGAAAVRSESIPIPAPMPNAPATGATYSHFFIVYPPERVIRPERVGMSRQARISTLADDAGDRLGSGRRLQFAFGFRLYNENEPA